MQPNKSKGRAKANIQASGRDRNIYEISTKSQNLPAKTITKHTFSGKELHLSNIMEVPWKREFRLGPSMKFFCCLNIFSTDFAKASHHDENLNILQVCQTTFYAILETSKLEIRHITSMH